MELELQVESLNTENARLNEQIYTLEVQNRTSAETIYKLQEKIKPVSRGYVSRKSTMIATAYTASLEECGKTDGITASGEKAAPNRTIAASKDIPFGTEICITCPSYPSVNGIYVVEDRGGAIKNGKVDIFMTSRSEARKFGRREVICEILN